VDLENPRTWVSAGLAAFAGLFAWSAKRHVSQFDEERAAARKAFAEHEGRLIALESHVATRDDIEGVYSRLNKMGDTMTEQHGKIMDYLIKAKL
jgi:hypothetical protein